MVPILQGAALTTYLLLTANQIPDGKPPNTFALDGALMNKVRLVAAGF